MPGSQERSQIDYKIGKKKTKLKQPRSFPKEEYFLSKLDILMLARGLLMSEHDKGSNLLGILHDRKRSINCCPQDLATASKQHFSAGYVVNYLISWNEREKNYLRSVLYSGPKEGPGSHSFQ